MWRLVLALGVLGACHKLFGLDQVGDPVPPDVRADAAPALLDKWASTTPLPVGRDYNHTHAAFIGDTLYMIGGYDVTGPGESAVVYRATSTDGELGPWTTTVPLPAARALGDVVTIGNRIYVVGGANFSVAQTSVYVNDASTGDLTSWTATTPLLVATKAHAATAANGYLYIVGGADALNVRQPAIYRAAIMTDGDLGPWQMETNPLPTPRANLAGLTANGYLYAIGGDADDSLFHATVSYAPLDPDSGAVGAWAMTTSLPSARRGIVAVTDSNYIYVIGGETSSTALSDVLHSRIGEDGTLGPWEANEPLLLPRMRHAGVLANGRLFVLGGATAPTSVERSSQLAR